MITVPACGNDSPPLESASVCMQAWQPLTAAKPYDMTSPLLYRDGTLYLSTELQGMLTVPTTTGQPMPLSAVTSLELWIEGDHLVFPGASQPTQMWSLPLAGGTPQLLADGGAGRTNVGIALHHAFNDSDFFWTEQPPDLVSPFTVWRMSRSGGAPVQLGSAAAAAPLDGFPLAFEAIALGSDGVVMAAEFGLADVIPYDGGPTRPLAVPSASKFADINLAGVDPAGAYWLIPRPGSSADADEWDLVLAPADGGPVQKFWSKGPPHSGIDHIWPDGGGGWVMVGSQMFDDHLFHTTIWLLDAEKTATRIGCSAGYTNEAWIETPVAVAPDGVYAVSKNLSAPTWEIDRIAR